MAVSAPCQPFAGQLAHEEVARGTMVVQRYWSLAVRVLYPFGYKYIYFWRLLE